MNEFKKINPYDITDNPFKLIGKDWALITSGDESSFNSMTASWGGVGVLWNKPVATVYIRPQRYTFEFTEKNELFTLSFFTEEQREALTFCGRNSGRDCDKAKETGLTPIFPDGAAAYDEARLILVCRKLYHDDINPANFHNAEIDEKNYPQKDYHRMYIGEIIAVYER